MRIWTPKQSRKQPCHPNRHLQTASDVRKHRNRFRLNPFAKVGSLFVPQPLRMSPGYPCCCALTPCVCSDALDYYCNFTIDDEISVTIDGDVYVCTNTTGGNNWNYDNGCNVIKTTWDWGDGYPCIGVSLFCPQSIPDESCESGYRPSKWGIAITASITCYQYGGGSYCYGTHQWQTLTETSYSFPACSGTRNVPFSGAAGGSCPGNPLCDNLPSPPATVKVVF